jgi:hypothetical protein
MASVANLLLRITGDSDDAEAGLTGLQRKLAKFARTTAEAEAKVDTDEGESDLLRVERELAKFARTVAEAGADVDTDEGRAKAKALQDVLGRIDRDSVSAEANVRIAGAIASLSALGGAFNDFDGQRATGHVDIKVNQGIVRRIGAISKSVNILGRSFLKAGADVDKGGDAFSETDVDIDRTGRRVRVLSGALGILGKGLIGLLTHIPAIGRGLAGMAQSMGESIAGASSMSSQVTVLGAAMTAAVGAVTVLSGALSVLVAGLGAVALSLGGAAVGLGAVGVAALASAGPLGIFGATLFGMIKRVSKMDKMKGATQNIRDLRKALLTGMGGEFDSKGGLWFALVGVNKAAKTLIPTAQGLRGAWDSLGRAFAESAQTIADGVAQLGPQLQRQIRDSGTVLRALAPAIAPFLEVLLNIAHAALPFLIQGINAVTAKLKGWASATRDTTALSARIGVLIAHFRLWAGIISSVSAGLRSMFSAAEPQIRAFVQWIAKGAAAFARWAASADGRRQIQSFLSQALPMIQRLAGLVGKVAQLWQA